MRFEDIEIGKLYVIDENYSKDKTFVESIKKPFKDRRYVKVRWIEGGKTRRINVKYILREATEEDDSLLLIERL